MEELTLRCPVRGEPMVQVAPGVFQCPWCGYGPSLDGARDFWAVGELQLVDDILSGVACRWKPARNSYVVTEIAWRLFPDGGAVSGSIREVLIGEAFTEEEWAYLPLPVVVPNPDKWLQRPNVPALRPLFFREPGGPKVLDVLPSPPSRYGGGRARSG